MNWETIREYDEIKFDFFEGIAKISINRPEKHNAFTPRTVIEMIDAMNICRDDTNIEVIIFTGEGGKAFCSGGDQSVRGHGGYVGKDEVPRLNVLDLQKQIRSIPKVVIAAVAGWSIGGGHVLHVVCHHHVGGMAAVWMSREGGGGAIVPRTVHTVQYCVQLYRYPVYDCLR